MNRVTTYTVRLSTSGKVTTDVNEALELARLERERLDKRGYEILADNVTITENSNRFCNRHGYSDVTPFEIVRVVSDKIIEVRQMDAELLNGDELKFHAGGFSANCSNQHDQKYHYTSNESNPTVRVHKRKDGKYYSKGGKFILATAPYKFYDYNF